MRAKINNQARNESDRVKLAYVCKYICVNKTEYQITVLFKIQFIECLQVESIRSKI